VGQHRREEKQPVTTHLDHHSENRGATRLRVIADVPLNKAGKHRKKEER
jgi:hypothetical protein